MVDAGFSQPLADCAWCHTEAATPLPGEPGIVRCSNCGLWRPLPRAGSVDQQRVLADADSSIDTAPYVEMFEHERGRRPSRFSIDDVEVMRLASPGLFSGGTALDVGASEGTFVQRLVDEGVRAEGLEPLGTLMQLATGFGLDVHVGRFERGGMPPELQDRRFDLLSFRESVYYLPDLSEGLELIQELLAPGGILYLKFHVPTSIYYKKHRDQLARYGPLVSFMPTLPVMLKILGQAGFKALSHGTFPFNPLYTTYAPRFGGLGGRVLGRALSPLVTAAGLADRAYIVAKADEGAIIA